MRTSKLLSKLRSGQAARTCILGHYLPFYVRYAAHFGYDAIWLDLEHRDMNVREVQSLLALCRTFDIDCMLRPPTLERNRLYRYLEDGATGFLIPFASDKDIAQKVVEAAKFPPLGNRGLDGAGLDADFGLQAWSTDSTYIDDANRETFIVAQIETPDAVLKAEEVAAVPGIDALFVGTGDLGLRLARHPTVEIANLETAIEKVAAAARRQGKAWGAATGSIEDLRTYRRMGAQIIPWGNDFDLSEVLANRSADLDAAIREAESSLKA
jgi:4-hydroxy-2-oxoheptanedioate aldolase